MLLTRVTPCGGSIAGIKMNHEQVRDAVSSCLLTDEEMLLGPSGWESFDNPFEHLVNMHEEDDDGSDDDSEVNFDDDDEDDDDDDGDEEDGDDDEGDDSTWSSDAVRRGSCPSHRVVCVAVPWVRRRRAQGW